MTIDIDKNNLEKTNSQEKIDAESLQKKNDTDSSQQTLENSQPDENIDPNWKAFREARKRDRLEREAAERKAAEKEAEVSALKAAMEAAFSKSAPSPQAYQQYYGMQSSYDQNDPIEETEDQKIERKVNALLNAKEERIRKEHAERERQDFPNRLSRSYPDFNSMVSQENLDYLDYHYPEVSRPLQRLPDDYDKWVDIYHAVKKFVPNHANSKKDALRADANNQKPKSISSTGITQSGESSRQTFQEVDQRRAANWERMQKILKGV